MYENLLFTAFALGPIVLGVVLYVFFRRTGRRRPATPRPLRLIVGNLLVLLFLASSALVGGEVYYRFWYNTTDSFAQAKVTQRWFRRYYHLNDKGVRDSMDYAARVAPGKRRVTFLGDSFTAGHGVPDVEDRFANRLRAQRSRWEVHVLAKNGFDTGMHLMMLDNLAQWGTYDFDQVVLVYCVNDTSDMIESWQRKLGEIGAAMRTEGFLVKHSYLINTFYYRLKAARDPDLSDYYRCVFDAYTGPLWQQQQARLTELHNRIRAQGGRLRVVTFPFLHTLGPDNRYRPIHRQLDEFWRSLGVPHLDLMDLFEDHRAEDLMVNRRDPHPNERAHELAADAIAKFLDEQAAASP